MDRGRGGASGIVVAALGGVAQGQIGQAGCGPRSGQGSPEADRGRPGKFCEGAVVGARRRRIWKAILAGAFVCLLTFLALSWLTGEPVALWYRVVGVDVSHYQGEIDWPVLARSGVRFAYIKATEGATVRDDHFQRNWSDAAASGLARGAYHFFTPCRGAEVQAKNFIAATPVVADALPPVIDAEQMGPCRSGHAMDDPGRELLKLQKLLADRYHRQPLIYVTKEFDRAYLQALPTTQSLWVRSLFWRPPFRQKQWIIWQYQDHANRAGIAHDVDLNVFRGDEGAFEAWRRGNADSSKSP